MVHKITFPAMGTEVEIGIVADEVSNDTAAADLLQARTEIERLERLLSRFLPTSDISRLNEQPGAWIQVQAETARVLRLAEQACQQTDGLFNPCLGAWMEHHGYHESFHLGLDRPDAENVEATARPQLPSPALVTYESSSNNQFRLQAGYRIDVGGIAKGWIMERAADLLRQRGYRQFVCSAGGDMVCEGRNNTEPWTVGIASPTVPNESVLTLRVESCCIATSGTYRRRWKVGDRDLHHILDPWSGQPAESDVVSCTVVHKSLVAAEVMAKVFLLLGIEQGREWISQRPNRGWVAITRAGEVVDSWKS